MGIAAIIADDFSSATDCGVQFSLRGLDTVALMHTSTTSQRIPYDVVAIDTDSRAVSSLSAYKRVLRAARLVKSSGYRYIYKSLDSTLRGNLGIEIDAMLDVFNFDFAFVAPAFPYYGRTTIDGCHFLNGIPISQSSFAHDPIWPAKESNLVKLLSSQTKRGVGLITLHQVREGLDKLIPRLEQLKAQGKQLVVFDAESEDDLKRIADISATLANRSLIVGSTGLSQYLPDAWKITVDSNQDRMKTSPKEPIMLIAGSASPTTRQQVARFNEDPHTFAVVVDSRSIFSDLWPSREQEILNDVQLAIDSGKDIAVHLSSSPQDVQCTQELGRSKGLNKRQVSHRIVMALAACVADIVRVNKVSALLLTGGDTAKAVCRQLGAIGMRLLSEVEPGIPVGRLIGPNDILVVTKAGAFGSEYALEKARRVLRGAC